MMDLVVVVLILCFVIGIISSALFLASFYLYRESRLRDAQTQNESAAIPMKAAPPNDVGVGLEIETERRRMTSNCAAKRRGEHMSETATACGANSETSSNCSYTCEVCGSCCAGDRRQLDEPQPGQGDSCQQTPPTYPCGEFFVSSVDVGFKCQAGADSGGGGKQRGTFFFFRGRQSNELLEPVPPSNRYLIMAALPSVPYHLWFCPGQQHSAKSLRCPECRSVFSFELCDSEILFHHSQKRLPRCVWLLAYEETSGNSSVIYRGDAGSLTRLQYTGKLFVYFGLPTESSDSLPVRLPCAGPTKHLACSGLPVQDSSVLEKNTDVSAPAPTAGDPPDLLHRQQRFRRRRFGFSSCNDESFDLNGNADNDKEDSNNSDTNNSNNTDASPVKNDIGKEPTPLSMGSMRNAARWPITQFENVIESSSSDDPVIPIATISTGRQPSSPLPPPPPSPAPPQDESNIDTSMACESDRFSVRLENCEDD